MTQKQQKQQLSANSKALVEAAREGNIVEVERLLPLSNPRYAGSLPYRTAARMGHLECMRLLLPHSVADTHHSIALRHAGRLGRVDMIDFLLPHCDPKARNSEAIYNAVSNNHWNAFERLLPYSDPKAKDSFLLQAAAHAGNPNVVAALLPLTEPKKTNAAGWASLAGHLECVTLLAPHCDLDKDFFAVWRHSVTNYHPDILQYLASLDGIDVNMFEHMALAEAVTRRDIEMVDFLFERCNRLTVLEDLVGRSVSLETLALIEDRLAFEQHQRLEQHIQCAPTHVQRKRM